MDGQNTTCEILHSARLRCSDTVRDTALYHFIVHLSSSFLDVVTKKNKIE
jgi:hypothetical protein